MKTLLCRIWRGVVALARAGVRVVWRHKDEVAKEARESLVKETVKAAILGAILGVSLGLAAPGCGGLAQSDRTTSTSVWAIGVPGVAILREASMHPDNRGADDKTATQVNTIDVSPKFK